MEPHIIRGVLTSPMLILRIRKPIMTIVPWLYPISMILPQTHALSAVRLILSGAGLSSPTVQLHIAYMLSFSLLVIPIGFKLTNRGIDRIRREGYSPPSGGEVII